MQSLAQARLKRARAVELAVEGYSYEEIARRVGYTNRGSAHRAVFKALGEREVQAVEELRHVELDRLEQLHATYWPKAIEGDRAAAQVILKVMDRRIRLQGLADDRSKPTQPMLLVQPDVEGNPREATVPVGDTSRDNRRMRGG